MENMQNIGIMKQRFYRKALELQPQTSFTCIEIEGLLRIFHKLIEKYQAPMTKNIFKDVLFNFFGLANDMLREKIFRVMTNGQAVMSYDDWILGMNVFLRGDIGQQANFSFSCYDHQKRGVLSKEDMQIYLRNVLVIKLPDEDRDECQSDLLDMAFVLLDRDKDGYISRKDFLRSISAEPLLMHILGDCVPTRASASTLESLIRQDDPSDESSFN